MQRMKQRYDDQLPALPELAEGQLGKRTARIYTAPCALAATMAKAHSRSHPVRNAVKNASGKGKVPLRMGRTGGPKVHSFVPGSLCALHESAPRHSAALGTGAGRERAWQSTTNRSGPLSARTATARAERARREPGIIPVSFHDGTSEKL